MMHLQRFVVYFITYLITEIWLKTVGQHNISTKVSCFKENACQHNANRRLTDKIKTNWLVGNSCACRNGGFVDKIERFAAILCIGHSYWSDLNNTLSGS